MTIQPFSLNRRKWLIGTGAAALTALSARIAYPIARKAGGDWVTEYVDDKPPSDDQLRAVAEFTAVLVGRNLSPHHIDLLVKRLAFNRKRSRRLASQYAEVAAYANDGARNANSSLSGFSEAPAEIRRAVMAAVMIGNLNTARAKLAALLTTDGRARWRIRNATAIHLRTVYLRTTIPWQYRGYRGAPGAPASSYEYTDQPNPAQL